MDLKEFSQTKGIQAKEELLNIIYIYNLNLSNEQWYNFLLKYKMITRATKQIRVASVYKSMEEWGILETGFYGRLPEPKETVRIQIMNGSRKYVLNLYFRTDQIKEIEEEMLIVN